MALTKVTGQVINSTTDLSVGVATVGGGTSTGDLYVVGVTTFSGDVSVGGTLTYEDVTNVDSVGLITARKGITVTANGLNVNAGISTFNADVKVGSGITLSPDGDVYITGVSTFSGAVSGTTGTFSSNLTASGSSNVLGNTTINGAGGAGGAALTIDYSGTDIFKVVNTGKATITGDVSIADKIIHTGDTDTALRFPSADTFSVETGGSESLRVDSSQRLLVGTTSSRSAAAGEHKIQIESNGTNGLSLTRATADAGAINISFIKTRNGAIVQSGDDCGAINWFGDDGTDTNSYLAKIQGMSDGTPGSNDMPGRLVFSTTSDGDHTTDERMRITSTGRVGINESSPACMLDVEDGASGGDGITEILRLNGSPNNTNDGIKINFARAGSSCGHIVLEKVNDNNTTDLKISTRASNTVSESVRITGNGDVKIKSFGDSSNASADALQIGKTDNNYGMTILSATNAQGRIDFTDTEDTNDPQGKIAYYHDSNSIRIFVNGNTERARITSNGFSIFTNDGTIDTYSSADDAHQFRSNDADHTTLWVSNTNTDHEKELLRLDSARAGSSSFYMLSLTTGNLSDDQFLFRGDGNAYADASWNANGADYAEYFEWTDGNSSDADRRGITVVLDGNKIRPSTSSDSADDVIGVVSSSPVVVGDGAHMQWNDKYLRDEYGAYDLDENGERKLNPSYDSGKTYTKREDRKEWDIIGLVGKLRIRKGQKTGTRWIKMRDTSDTIEEWLVR